MKINRILPALLLTLSGCASDADIRKEIVSSVRNGQLNEAAERVFDDSYMKSASDRFIREAERGSVQYLKGNYYQALKHFDRAVDIAKQLFTVSISKTVGAQIFGDSMKDYGGERYEQSLVRFYQSLCHYMLYQQGFYEAINENTPKKMLTPEERRKHLYAARATIVEWDSFLTDMSHSNAGKAVFKQDMTAKIWGGLVHRAIGTSTDKQISDKLFQQVPLYLTRNYAMYPAYNVNWIPYVREYRNLPQKSAEELKETYLKSTRYTQTLRELIQPSDTDKNATIVLKTGLVGERYASAPKFKLDPAFLAVVAAVSNTDMKVMLSLFLANGVITVPMPDIECPQVNAEYNFIIKDKSGKPFTKGAMALVDPVSEIACQEYIERYPSLVNKKLGRMGTKYAIAMAGAYAAKKAAKEYGDKQFGDGWGDLLALGAGTGTFAAEHAAIQASEKPDLRYWSLLPDAIWMQTLSLPEGEYGIEILNGDVSIYQDKFLVQKDKNTVIDINLPTE